MDQAIPEPLENAIAPKYFYYRNHFSEFALVIKCGLANGISDL
jgi:hypothetical protein